MLVLSRKKTEKIVVPSLGVTIEVVAIKGNTVRLGISAPPDVNIVRAELHSREAEWGRPEDESAADSLPRLRRLVRERLRVSHVGLNELRRQIDDGTLDEARLTLESLTDDLRLLVRRLEAESRPAAATKPAPVKALLVEDNACERLLLATYLRKAGLDVDTAGDGTDALDYLHERSRPDVVLLDMGLPRCDGATTVREIRRDPALADLKIFAVTGHRAEEYNLAQGPSGIDGWFHKPVDPDELLENIDRALHPETPSI